MYKPLKVKAVFATNDLDKIRPNCTIWKALLIKMDKMLFR